MCRVILPLALLLHLQAYCQSPAFPADRRCVFSCLSLDEAAGPLHYRTLVKDPKAPVYFTIDKPTPLVVGDGSVKVPSGFRSEPQPYLGPAVLDFFLIPPPLANDGKEPMPPPVARVVIPLRSERILLVFSPQRESAELPGIRHQVQVLPDGLDVVPMGGYLIVNTTGKKLIGSVDATAFELDARSHLPLRSPADVEQNLEWRLWLETRKDRPIYSAVWNHRPSGRSLIFIADSADQRSALTVRAIQESGEPVKPKIEPPSMPK